MNVGIILAGGTGTRLGADIPKQYIEVSGRPVISYCLERFLKHPLIDMVCVVAEKEWHELIEKTVNSFEGDHVAKKWNGFSSPGENRQLSVYYALKDLYGHISGDDYVMIHDAARPLISTELITNCLREAEGHDGVVPVLPMKDTIYYSDDGKTISSLLKRESLFAGQAPEVFRFGKYYDANKALLPNEILKINGSTEAAVLAGMDIAFIPGDEENFKITTKEDLECFYRKLKQQMERL